MWIWITALAVACWANGFLTAALYLSDDEEGAREPQRPRPLAPRQAMI